MVSGVTNVRLLLSQEPERNLSEDVEEPEEIKLAKISAEMRHKQGKVEQNLLSKLDSVKHKWRDKLTREQIMNKYRHSPETGVSSHYKFSNNYIRIDGSCENPELYDTLNKLSALMFLKYKTTRGMVTKARVIVSSYNKVDDDVEIVKRSNLTEACINVCLDSGADLSCGQAGFLESCNFQRLNTQKLSVVTVFGSEVRSYKRYNVDLKKQKKGMENLAVLSVPDIGRENKITEEFLSRVKEHFHFKSEFLETISRAHGKLHLLT